MFFPHKDCIEKGLCPQDVQLLLLRLCHSYFNVTTLHSTLLLAFTHLFFSISYLSHLEPSHKKHPHPPWPQANQVGREASSTSQAILATSPHKTESPPAASWPPGNRSEASPRLVRRGKQSYKVVIIRARERERGLVVATWVEIDSPLCTAVHPIYTWALQISSN